MDKKIKKILITGSSGTIGTRLFEKLLELGFNAVGFDKKKNKWHKELNNLTIVGNLLNGDDIEKIPKNIDIIIHLAANARVYDLVVEPDLAMENILSMYNILEFARKNKINKIIFSSSREIYGNRKKIKANEKDVDINRCESSYSASKMANEALIYSYQKCYNINCIILRFSNVYGMYDDSNRFFPLMIKKMRKNENVEIFGKNKILDFTYIDDCVDGIIKSIEKFDMVKNNTFNVASGKGEKLINVVKIIKSNLKSKSSVIFNKNRTGEVIKYVADISKVKNLLDYSPKNSIKNGVDKTIKWYKNIWM